MSKSNLGKKGFILLILPIRPRGKSKWELRQGRSPGTVADTEATDPAQPASLTEPRKTSPGIALSIVSWALPHKSLKLRKCPAGLGTAQSGGIFLIEVPSPQLAPAGLKLT